MKISKKILLALFIAVSAGSFSSVSIAETAAGVAIDNVGKKIDLALAAIAAGQDSAAVAALIKDAKDASKEINASDVVSFATNKARNEIKNAAAETKNGDLKTAAENLKKAKSDFAKIKPMLNQ